MIVGATGAVGSRALDLAVDDPRVSRVVAPTRCPLPERAKLTNPVLDFTDLDADPGLWQVDAVACALGTTRRLAGSAEAFRRVDHDLIVAIAERTRAAGARSFSLVSSVGADAEARAFYLRVKGETEDDVRRLGFGSLTLVRPSGLVGGVRSRRNNLGDHLVGASRAIQPLIPRRYRPVHVDRVARALLDGALSAPPGVTVRESETL